MLLLLVHLLLFLCRILHVGVGVGCWQVAGGVEASRFSPSTTSRCVSGHDATSIRLQ